jgi:hypothetical protein
LNGENLEGEVYGVNMSSNTFTNCYTTTTGGEKSIIKLGQNAQYVSIHQSIFDKDVIERTHAYGVIPCIDVNGVNSKNFIDTLDPRTDKKRILKFNFAQPQWEYLNYLCNLDGKVVLTIDGNDSDITASNGLNITQNSNELNIKSVGNGDVVIEQSNESSLILGKGSEGNSGGKIVLNKTLDLNGNTITNNISTDDGNKRITFTPSADSYLEIDPSANNVSGKKYEEIILGNPNAIPNVQYVENAATSSLLFKIDSSCLNNLNSVGYYDLITFDSRIFGDNVYIKNISINVRKPFYRTHELKDVAFEYIPGEEGTSYQYYEGEIVKGKVSGTEDVFGIVTRTHIAETDFYNAMINGDIMELPSEYLTDVHYIDIVSPSDNGLYSLTKKYNNDYKNLDFENTIFTANITKINSFGFNPSTFNPNETDEEKQLKCGPDGALVKYQDRIFYTHPKVNIGTSRILNVYDLHNVSNINDSEDEFEPMTIKKYSEGYNYIYDMDRTIIRQSEPINMSLQNMCGRTLSVMFADKQGQPITNFTNSTQLCPTGELIVRIDYIKNEVK